jgi:hypothetical protein
MLTCSAMALFFLNFCLLGKDGKRVRMGRYNDVVVL